MLCIILLTFLYRVQLPTSSEYCIRTGFLLLYVCVLTELGGEGRWRWLAMALALLALLPPLSHTRGVSIRQARQGYTI